MLTLSVVVFTVLSLCLSLVAWIWHKKKEDFFRKENVPFIPAPLFGGNLKDYLLMRKPMCEVVSDIYNDKKTKQAPIVGVRFLFKNSLVIKDLELIKRILVKDFHNFPNRSFSAEATSDPLGSHNLFMVKNPVWRVLRVKITPLFSSLKMRNFFEVVNNIGLEFSKKINKDIPDQEIVNMKELNVYFMTDIYASCAFGIQANSIQNPKSDFGQKALSMFNFTIFRGLEFGSNFIWPEIAKVLRWNFFSKDGSEFLKSALTDVMNEREAKGIVRNDLMDIVVNLRKNNSEAESYTDDELLAQCAIFFVAGFETTSTAVLHCLYELAKQPDLQKKLKEEIQTFLSKHKTLNYDNIHELEYLTTVCKETFRMYPVFPFLNRECTPEDGDAYSLKPDVDFDIPRGLPVYIPTYGLHYDERYFPNPHHYDPDRFNAENINNIPKEAYLPFGMGPRGCLAERLGYLVMKTSIFHLLNTHSVEVCEKTVMNLRAHMLAILVVPGSTIYLRIRKDK